VIEGKLIVANINFEINPGENWVVIGPNGSGKTTLLKAICGYQGISQGSVEVLGQRFGETDLRDLRTQIGMISSYLSDLILLDDNVLDLVVSGQFGQTRLWSVPPYEAVHKGRSLLRLLGVARYEDKILRELSQGERQRVLIARAMMANSQLLVLDEPCAGLDLKGREYLLSGLSRIGKNRSKTMIYTTHSIDEIPNCFTHALLLSKGRVVAKGKIADALTGPNMTRCFGVGLEIRKWRGRYYALVK
jgi:iron complex transport system ATP-binding protein